MKWKSSASWWWWKKYFADHPHHIIYKINNHPIKQLPDCLYEKTFTDWLCQSLRSWSSHSLPPSWPHSTKLHIHQKHVGSYMVDLPWTICMKAKQGRAMYPSCQRATQTMHTSSVTWMRRLSYLRCTLGACSGTSDTAEPTISKLINKTLFQSNKNRLFTANA